MTPSQKLRSIADSTGLDGIADAIREIAEEIEHNNAPAVPQGWREVFDRAHNRLSNDDPSAFDNSGYRAYAGQVLDYVEDELDALTSKAAQSQSTATHKCNTCGVVGAEDPVKGCLNCGFDDMQLIAATPAPAPAQEVTLSLAAEDVHAAFAKNFPKSRISQAWINFAADIAQAIAARAAKPAQEVGLTDEEKPWAVNKLMEQAQVFASAWSLVGGRHDFGNALEEAEQAKTELRSMVVEALRAKGGK